MKIALIGGGGYLGSVIHQELQKHNAEIVIYDNALFSDEYLTTVSHNKVNILTESVDMSGFDKILWCCDIDDETFYRTTFSQDYIKKNKEAFKKYCKLYKKKMYWVKDDIELGKQPEYGTMLGAKTKMINDVGGKIYQVGQLYGPSPRMRFDTFVNSLFLMAVTEGALYLDGWLEQVMVQSVGLTGQNIALDLMDNGEYVQDGICLSKVEFAYMVAVIFDRKVGIVCSDNKGDRSRSILISNKEDDNFNIEKSVKYMREALERGMIDDVMKDMYNNSRIVANFVASDNFFKFKNEIVG